MEHTYSQIKEVIGAGVGVGTIAKIKKLVEEKTEKLKQLGDAAWKKGLEEAKPYMDKNPEIKKIVEENADSLKNGNLTKLWSTVKEAATSGDTSKLSEYAKSAGEKAKNSGAGSGLDKYIRMIPGGSEILPKLQKLQEAASKHGGEAETIVKGAYKDVSDVLQKRTGEIEKLADKAAKDSKK